MSTKSAEAPKLIRMNKQELTNMRLVRAKFPFAKNPKIEKVPNYNGEIIWVMSIDNYRFTLSGPTSGVARRLEKIENDTQICPICVSKYSGARANVSCTNCAVAYCSACYINIYRVGRGIIVCPFCRHTYGRRVVNSRVLEYGISEIRRRVRMREVKGGNGMSF